jgi:hypothetical protein
MDNWYYILSGIISLSYYITVGINLYFPFSDKTYLTWLVKKTDPVKDILALSLITVTVSFVLYFMWPIVILTIIVHSLMKLFI